MMAPSRTPGRLALTLLAASAAALIASAAHADSQFITTGTALPRDVGRPSGSGGLLSRVRTAMGLAPEPGKPMRLVPPQPETVFTARPAPSSEADALQDERRTNALHLGEPPVSAMLRRPPTRPLVSVVPPPPSTDGFAAMDAPPSDEPVPRTEAGHLASRPAEPPVPRRHPARMAQEGVLPTPNPRATPAPAEPAIEAVAAAVPDRPDTPSDIALASNSPASSGDAATPESAPPDGAAPSGPAAEATRTRSPSGGADSAAGREAGPAAVGTAPSGGTDHGPVHGHQDADAPPKAGADAHAQTAQEPPRPSELPKLMRTMSALQDDIARGAGTALAAQRVLSKRVAEEIAATAPETLALPVNARALLHYALTGGSPEEVRAAVDRSTFAPPYDALMAGALAFLEGRKKDARRHFDAANLDHLPSVVVGPVHLALAALSVEKDPQRALRHLDRARFSAPGTLVEEAALRRAVLIAAERNDIDRFETLTSRYLRKFRSSAYAGNFRRRLASALTRMSFLDAPDGFDKLTAVLDPMTPDGRREIYLDLARTAVETGRSAIAAKAARRSREIAPSNSLDATRADLYAAAADVVDPGRNDAAVAALDTIDVTPLPEGDRVLRTAALRLGQAVADLPAPAPPANLLGDELARAPAAYGPTFADAALEEEPSAIEQRVRTTLAEIDAILRTSP